jgi:hypothetical protein
MKYSRRAAAAGQAPVRGRRVAASAATATTPAGIDHGAGERRRA